MSDAMLESLQQIKWDPGAYPNPVWFNPNVMSNILSQNEVTKHYHLTMDTAQHNWILLH